jgi:hypothetical protein
VVSVGGTDLVTASAAGPWQSETAWSDSGGGISPDGIPIPAWQQLAGVINSSNKGSTSLRNGPDVSANADFTFYVCANQTTCTANEYGGTSFATPMWAAYIALVNEQLASSGKSAIGFINPKIYAQNISGGALTAAYAADFHDVTSGTSGSYSAVGGYDLVTGWGSPKGAGLINALAPTTPGFSLAASPTSVSVAVGSSGTSRITTAVSGGFSSAIALSESGAPTGVTVSFSPASIAAPGSGTSTVTLAVASTTASGTYTITVTGKGESLTESAKISLIVTSASTPAFTLVASHTVVDVAQGKSGTTTINTAVSGAFNAAIALSESGAPAGVTVSFSPASIAAPGGGASKMILAVASTAATGTYTITVKGVGDGITHTAAVSLTVTAAIVGSFTISVSPTAGYLYPGQSGYAVVTTTASGGFDSAITLSATGIPSGVTGSFSPTSITGSGTSELILTVAGNASSGTYPITITGKGGGVTQSTELAFSVEVP